MSGIFRPAFRLPQPVQAAGGVLSGSASSGGVILPIHLPSAALVFAPLLRRSVSATLFGGGSAFAAIAVRVTLRPVSVSSSSAYFDAAVSAGGGIATGLFINGSSLAAPRLTLRVLPVVFANPASVHAPGVGSTGVKGAPLVANGGAIYAPRIDGVQTFDVVGTLDVAGWSPRAPRRSSRAATWPRLPIVDAPPWRLTVVTPEVARWRARSLMAQRRRSEKARRTREAKRSLDHHLDEMTDVEIANMIVRFVSEER